MLLSCASMTSTKFPLTIKQAYAIFGALEADCVMIEKMASHSLSTDDEKGSSVRKRMWNQCEYLIRAMAFSQTIPSVSEMRD